MSFYGDQPERAEHEPTPPVSLADLVHIFNTEAAALEVEQAAFAQQLSTGTGALDAFETEVQQALIERRAALEDLRGYLYTQSLDQELAGLTPPAEDE